MPTDNLWPDDLVVGEVVETPGYILRQQADGLRKRTRDLVEGEVSTTTAGNQIVHRFYLKAPILDYRVPLFEVRHGLDPYPATFSGFGGFEVPLKTIGPEEFRDALRRIFGDEKTRRTVGQLRAYALERGLPYLLVENEEIVGEARTLALAMQRAREAVSRDSEIMVLHNGVLLGHVSNHDGNVTERVAGSGTL